MKFRDWTSLRYALYWAYEGEVLSSARVGTYGDSATACWLIRRGRVKVTAAGKSVTAGPNQWVFVASPKRHQDFSDDAEILSLHFHLSWPGGEAVIERKQNVVFDASDFPQLERAALPLLRHLRRSFPGSATFLPAQECTMSSYLRVQNLLPVWLAAYIETEAALGNHARRLEVPDNRVLESLNELDRQPLSQRFCEADLIQRAGLGRSHFNSLFLAATGMSPRRYFDRRRLSEACTLLRHTETSIKEIAFGLGFRYESHFTAWFRKGVQATPSAYRKQHRHP